MIGTSYAVKLQRLGIDTVKDLVFHTPSRFLDFSKISSIQNLQIGEFYTIKGVIISTINQYSKRGVKMQLVNIKDDTGNINAIWFNQPYILATLKKGAEFYLAGKVEFFGRNKAFISPEYELIKFSTSGIHTGRLVPIYPETAGITSKWLRSRINAVLKLLDENDDYLPQKIKTMFGLQDLYLSVKQAHFPISIKQQKIAVKRLGFDEMFMLQLVNQKKKLVHKNKKSHPMNINNKSITKFYNSLPFQLTTSQIAAIGDILSDLKMPSPMHRLLQGDVGSGKTVVAATAALVTRENNLKSIFMAPTQLLANQHFNTLKSTFKNYQITVALLTSSDKVGDINFADIVVGTHALIFKQRFKNVGLLTIDEQHRFGVSQRNKLIKLAKQNRRYPHILNMTATPIPRTAAMTYYGDLDLSTLNELPAGRKKITTWIIPETKRKNAYDWILDKINNDQAQVYIVCPLIEESDKESMAQIKAAKVEFDKLVKYFGRSVRLKLLHGKLKSKEKDSILKSFKAGKTDILVTTPVIEVGIDVPKATIMLIEASERFGLAQLHQLRGRVGRSETKSYCLLFTSNDSENNLRLRALTKTNSGFELAELDLKLRGPGEIYGVAQHGFPKLKNANWSDIKLVQNALKGAEMVFKSESIKEELYSHYLFSQPA